MWLGGFCCLWLLHSGASGSHITVWQSPARRLDGCALRRPAFMLHLLSAYSVCVYALPSMEPDWIHNSHERLQSRIQGKSDRQAWPWSVTALYNCPPLWYFDLITVQPLASGVTSRGTEAQRQFEQGMHIVDLISTSLVIGLLALRYGSVLVWASSIVQKALRRSA